MKLKILVISIIILILGISYCLYEIVVFVNGMRQDKVGNTNWQEGITCIYFVDLPAGLDTIKFNATVKLNKTKNIQKLKFPNGGTGTNVLIYDSTYLQNIQSTSTVKIKPLIEGKFKHDQEVVLDITNLSPGKYYVHYLSCNLGGIFPLTLK